MVLPDFPIDNDDIEKPDDNEEVADREKPNRVLVRFARWREDEENKKKEKNIKKLKKKDQTKINTNISTY
jgi:hypothetical protein